MLTLSEITCTWWPVDRECKAQMECRRWRAVSVIYQLLRRRRLDAKMKVMVAAHSRTDGAAFIRHGSHIEAPWYLAASPRPVSSAALGILVALILTWH